MVLSTTDKSATPAVSDNRTVLSPDASGTIHIPEGMEVGSLNFTREGQNLVLTAPDGTVLVIEGYFSAAEAPLILSEGGAMLSPQLVQSFLKTSGDVEVAASETASDKSPVGEVTEVNGEATVTRADGTKEKITSGTDIYEGDIVETDAKGAVNIKFVDDSTFAVSENARLAIDDFSFNAADQSGTTGVSILRGVFMFTSGLVGRENPDAVTINTPVGSIGIRGTIIGGEISENGQSQISVIEGAIVVRNGSGEQILSQQFETVTLTGYNNPIQNIGVLDANAFSQSYSSIRSVAPDLFTSINDAAGERNNQQQNQDNQQENQNRAQDLTGAAETDGAINTEDATLLSPSTDAQIVFQVLETGSNIENIIGAAPNSTQSNPNPEIVPVTVTPPPPPSSAPPSGSSNENQAPPAESVLDVRPPAPAVFIAAGNVNEESPVGTVVGTVGMSEALPFPVTYSIINNPGNRFYIDSNTGLVTLLAPAADVDTAGPTTYSFTVRVQRTETAQFSDATLSVSVTPVNETPEFDTGHTAISVAESGTTTLSPAKVGATDEESANITYTVSNLLHGIIKVSGSTQSTFTHSQLAGGLVVFHHDGAEPAAGASFSLTAGDGNTTSAPLPFSITVSNTNDAPTITSNGGATLNINRNENTLAVTTITTSDTDLGDTVSYALSGADASLFSIDTNGVITFNAMPNYESPSDTGGDNVYSLTVIATDTGGLSDTQSVNITILDANDNPTITSDGGGASAGLNVNENTTYVTTVTASDVDTSATFGYSITGGADQLLFSINPTTGVLSFANGKNFESPTDAGGNGVYDVQVTVSDGNGGSDVQNIAVTIDNVNEVPTSVALSASYAIDETNGSSATDISTIGIIDAEPLSNLSLGNFVVLSSTGSGFAADGRFEVYDNAGTWTLRLKSGQIFNYEQASSLTLRVDLTDAGSTVQSSTLALGITDVNEVSNTFTFNDNHQLYGTYAGLIQGQKEGSYIGVINFIEPDTNPTYKTDETDFLVNVTSVSGVQTGTLTNSDFEVKEITRDGHTDFILKLKDTRGKVDFIGTGGSVTVDVIVDRLGNGFSGGDDQTITLNLIGRDDTMVIDSVDGDSGFHIVNNSRFGGVAFGSSLAVGDFDNDGRNDLIFGAPLAFNGTSERSGGVYGMALTPTLMTNANDGVVNLSVTSGVGAIPPINGFFKEVQTGGADNDKFYGASVAGLKRFNSGAGADIAVSNAGEGKIEIIRDGNTASITSINNISTGATGLDKKDAINLASIGDINGDGYTDLLVGLKYYDNGGNNNEGKAFVVFGSGATTADVDASSITGRGFYVPASSTGAANNFFGTNVTGLGDFNGDGKSDFAISAIGVDTNGASAGSSQGQVTVFFGNVSAGSSYYASGSSKFIINGVNNNASIGEQIAGAGDYNDDGMNDLIIRNGSVSNGGEIFVIMGSANLNSDIVNLGDFGTNPDHLGFKIYTTAPNYTIGETLGSAGDFNGDGFDDIFVDVRKDLGGSNYEHTLAIIYGKGSYTNIDLASALQNPNMSYKIEMMASNTPHITATAAGDLNGDGFRDIVVGNPSRTYGNTEENGEAFVVYGGNYDGTAQVFSSSANASGSDKVFAGGIGNQSLNANTISNVSFYAGDGDDIMTISNQASVRNYDGGSGMDALKLFFSGEETGSGIVDNINMLGLGKNMTGVEKIQFDGSSKDDILQLDIRDIISLASSNGTGKIRIEAMSLIMGDENKLELFNGNIGTPTGNLSSLSADLQFTKNAGQQSLDGINFFVYTHTQSGVQMLVDDRLISAGALGT
ncbi:MAG: hypothetical protein EBQ96_02580 [Proteobacteria bacterium]|nr:hypothetical protein [Pseudomonadota bacterium]